MVGWVFSIWVLLVVLLAPGVAADEESKRSALASLDLTGVDPEIKQSIQSAIEEVRQAPSSDKTWGGLGMLLVAHGFYDASEICFIRAAKLNPKEYRWLYFHATALFLSDPEAAARLALAAAELCQDKPDVPRLRAAELLLSLDRFDEARTHFEKVLSRSPDHPRAHLGMARLATRRGQYDAAIKHLEKTSDHSSAKKASHQLLAQIHLLRGDRAAAEREQKAAAGILLDAGWPDPLGEELADLKTGRKIYLAKLDKHLAHNRIDEAIALGRETVKRYPESDVAWTWLGRALIKKRLLGEAETALLKAVELAPESIEALFHLGVVLFYQKRTDQAIAKFRRAIELKPDFAMAHFDLGFCLKANGDRKGAIEAIKAAVRCQPDLFSGHWELGNLLAQEQRYEESAAHLRDALRLNQHPQVRRLLDEVEKKAGSIKAGR
jgi:tetratricopeptide (TPR) repeat protein